MKILEINSVAGTASTGRIACQIADIAIQNGANARVAYGRSFYAKNCNVPVYRIGSDIDVKIHAGLSRITDRQGFYSKKPTKKLVDYIKRYNPDIIHLHNIHGYYLHLPTLLNFLAIYNKPVVWTLHDCWAFTGHCAYFNFVGCDKWKTGCNHCPQKKKYPTSLLFDQSKRNWEEKKQLFTSITNMNIITPSYWLAELVKESFLQKYPVQVINNGIDLNVFKYTPSLWKKNHGIIKPMILACAFVWDQRKGYTDVLELAKLLPEFQIVIVGVSKKQKKALPNDVIGIQKTNCVKELVEIYSAANIFVNPTYEDNYPTVNLEALACGTPVITYDTGGSPECIDESCGIVIIKGSVQELVEQIPSAIKLKKENCVLFSQNFSKTDKYLEYYNHFLNLHQNIGSR